MRTSVAVAVCLLAAGAGALAPSGSRGQRRPSQRIIGGQETDIEQFPWQVAVYHKTLGFKGGGSIISHKWVLTAGRLLIHCYYSGHCVDHTAEEIVVRIGSTHWNINGTVYEAEHLERYGRYLAALVKVQGMISMGEHIMWIALATRLPDAGATMTISGWGESSADTFPYDLRYKNVTLIDQSSCDQYYHTPKICTRSEGGGRGPSGGDVGGPLVANWTQYGIYAYTWTDEDMDYPDAYFSIPPLRSWIFHQTGL